MTDSKKENLFAKLAQANQPAAAPDPSPALPESPSPAPPKPTRKARKAEPTSPVTEPRKGKRDNPEYCQANAYIPRTVRRAVDKALLDIDGLDYSSLVTDLLRDWLKKRGVSE